MNQTPERLPRVAELIDDVAHRLDKAGLAYGHGTDNPDDEAIHLVLVGLDIDPGALERSLGKAVDTAQLERVNKLAEQRINERRPAAYVTGVAWLHGLSFIADERALVPRSLLVEAMADALPEWMALMLDGPYDEQWPRSVLDLCCGSGSIAIHAAHLFETASIVASDLSDDALSLAAENLKRHQLAGRVRLLQSDLFNRFESSGFSTFDLIACNPPYVNDASMAALPDEFRTEPDGALRGGHDGMDLVERIVNEAADWLKPNGILLLEIGHEAAHFEQRFAQLPFSYLPVAAGDQMVVVLTREQLAGQ